MSSGQDRVIFNNAERAVSDDFNRAQSLQARTFLEFVRALTQRSWAAELEPGVSIRAGAANLAPLSATVLDGLEVLIDSIGTGSVLVSPGTLAAWFAPPTYPTVDSGFFVVHDPGVTDTSIAAMQVTANTGSQPRCDVVEVTVVVDSEVTYESRDQYNETTELFDPVSFPKIARSHLSYRVRQGTPGTAPGYAANWLPLALLVLQPGITDLTKVDCYDVRPLYRDLPQDANADATIQSATLNLRSMHSILGIYGTKGSARFLGRVDAEYNRMSLSGLIRRNTPLAAADVPSLFGSTATNGGDASEVRWNDTNCLRGSGMSTTKGSHIVLCACFPMLDGVTPVPRCVRYGQSTLNNKPTQPARRKPQGSNGILLLVNEEQESVQFNADRILVAPAATVVAPGIQSCMGSLLCVPLSVTAMAADGLTMKPSVMGSARGMTTTHGLPAVVNRKLYREVLTASGTFTLNLTAATPAAGTSVGSGTSTEFDVEAGDWVHGVIGPIWVQTSTATDCGVRLALVENATGTSPLESYFDANLYNSVGSPVYIPFMRQISRYGILRVDLRGLCADGETVHIHNMAGASAIWGWIELERDST